MPKYVHPNGKTVEMTEENFAQWAGPDTLWKLASVSAPKASKPVPKASKPAPKATKATKPDLGSE